MRTAVQRGYCLHPEASSKTCGKQIIRAHTIQRRGGLEAIAANGHVYSVKAGASNIFDNHGQIVPKLVGLRSASTFSGFCGKHDAEMFKPVETGAPAITKENVFLLSFRAIAYELYEKQESLEILSINRRFDYGQPFKVQAEIQSDIHLQIEGAKRGLRDIRRWKDLYDRAYLAGDLSGFNFYAVEFSEVLPVAACGAFHPEFDFNGNRLQIITRGDSPFDHVAICLTTLNQRSVLTFGWIAPPDGPAQQLANSFKAIPDQEKASAALHMVFEHLENAYMHPAWWEGLDKESKSAVRREIQSGIGMSMRTGSSLSSRVPTLSQAQVIAAFG